MIFIYKEFWKINFVYISTAQVDTFVLSELNMFTAP